MELPILQNLGEPASGDLVRLYCRGVLHWTEHFGEGAALSVGTAFCNRELAAVNEANRVLDAGLPEGAGPAEAFGVVTDYYRGMGGECLSWVMNPEAAEARTEPMVKYLLERGYVRREREILHLNRATVFGMGNKDEVKIIPARASYRHARALAEMAAGERGASQWADAIMLHMDDPHWEAILALKDGEVIAGVGVLAVGEMGMIEGLYVVPECRREGLGRVMMGRVLEMCARSLFKHVFVGVAAGNVEGRLLAEKCGFASAGQVASYDVR